LTQEERGLPLPEEPSSEKEEADCEVIEVLTDGNTLEPPIVQESSDGVIKDEGGQGLLTKPPQLTEDSENLRRLPRRKTGREGSPTSQGPLKKVKTESGENESGISQDARRVASEEALLEWITTSNGVRSLSPQFFTSSLFHLCLKHVLSCLTSLEINSKWLSTL
jgi:hypothetical protein